MQNLDLKALRNAFGSFMTGVTIVSTIDADGTPVGFTANSFSSVSLEPPMLLVCPAKSLSSFAIFNQCEYFHVSILAHDQQAASNVFASNNDDRFSQVDWQPDANGCPAINGAIASFSCQRDRSIDAGDHIIMLGNVLDFDAHEKLGLGYGVGGYFSLNMERAATELQTSINYQAKQLLVGALVEHQGRVLLNCDEQGHYDLPKIDVEGEQPSFDTIEEFLTEQLKVEIEVGSVFSVFDHETENRSSIYYRVLIDHDLEPAKSGSEFYTIDQLLDKPYASAAIHSIVNRYVNERRSGNHNLYVGTDAAGKTHKVRGA